MPKIHENDYLIKKAILVSNMVYHYRVSVYNHLNSRLRSIGYELVVITNKLQRKNPHTANFRLIEAPFNFRIYKKIISDLDPAVVIVFLHIKDLIVWPLLIWLKRRKTNVIYWNHGVNLQTPDNIVKNCIFGIFHSVADAIILYSKNEIKHISTQHWSKLFVANNTINFESIPEIHESKAGLKRLWGTPFEKIILFVGRIEKNKRLDDLLDVANLIQRGTGIVIVGGGLSRKQKRRVDRLSNVMYLGEIYDALQINQIFKMSDIFSIPGKNGLGINQAFYWGLPAVTENVKHSPEIIYLKDDQNGFVVDKGDISELANKMNVLLTSESTYNRFSRAARDEIARSANIELMCEGFVNAVQFLEHESI